MIPEVISDLCEELNIEESKEIINQAINETKEDSIIKLINTLTDKSLKNKEGHNAGRNALKAKELFESDHLRYSYSKKTFKKLKNILQEKRIKLNLNQTSPNLKSPIFIKAKDDIDNHKL